MFMLFFFIIRQPPISTRTNTLVPYTTLSRADAMTLNFQGGKFVGWFLGNENGASRYSTIRGIGVGTTRAKAKQSVSIVDVEDSTLGEEFSIGTRSEEHTSELQSHMCITYAVLCSHQKNTVLHDQQLYMQ